MVRTRRICVRTARTASRCAAFPAPSPSDTVFFRGLGGASAGVHGTSTVHWIRAGAAANLCNKTGREKEHRDRECSVLECRAKLDLDDTWGLPNRCGLLHFVAARPKYVYGTDAMERVAGRFIGLFL